MPTIDLPDDELVAVTAAIRRAIEDDKFPHAPRLDPLRAALARLEAATADRKSNAQSTAPEPTPDPKAPPAAKADKRARRAPGRQCAVRGGHIRVGKLGHNLCFAPI